LATDQAETVIKWWWKHHNLTGRSEKKLVKAIIPAAWRDVAEYVVGWKAAHKALYTTTCITTERETSNPGGRPLSARTCLVLRLADENPGWSVGKIASAAVVSLKSAWIALRRHQPGRVTEVTPVLAIEDAPAPAVDDEVELMTPDDVMIDLDALETEYAAAVAAGMFEEAVEEEIEAHMMATRPTAAVIKATMPDFDAYLEPELVTVEPAPPMEAPPIVEEAWPFGTREFRARALAEWEAGWKLENRERPREFRKRPNYHSLAELKREAKAKRHGRGYVRLPSQLDPDLERLNELDSLRYHGEEDTA
jgi:hypothetical protein